MKNLGSKLAFIGIVTILGIVLIWPPRERLKLGIDLSGGTILVYQVEKGNKVGVTVDELIAALKQRINPEGVLDIPIRAVGNDRLEIILPEATPEEVESVKQMITNVGSLEFRILANRKHDAAAVDRALATNGLARPPARYIWAKLGERVTGQAPTIEGSTLTDDSQAWTKNQFAGRASVLVSGKDAGGRDVSDSIPILRNSTSTLTLQRAPNVRTAASYTIDFNQSEIVDTETPDSAVVREEEVSPGRFVRYALCKQDRYDVTGSYLARAYVTQDERLQPAVGFIFNRLGARKFGNLTGDHLPEEGGGFRYRLAIVLDNMVMSAPSINSQIRESGIIEGGSSGFKQEEVRYLINVLKSGSLPATLNPVPLLEETIGPTLGEDTINKGIRAIFVSMLIVPLFMILYYRFCGIVAVLALILNIILLLASMALFQASFTLPGLAGLALTIGMAVDANVLIFERMREEKERGANMAQQIRNGFSRAWSTIFDANVTTVLSAIVLWAVGTEEVKGFALTLIIGLVWNLFTAVFVSRVIFDSFYSKGWLKKVTMLQLIGKTNIDFIGVRRVCMTASLIVVVLGLGAVAIRGKNILNIDFTGGTLLTVRLDPENPEIKSLSPSARASYVRSKARVLPDVTVETLNVARVDYTGGTMVSDRSNERVAPRFNIRTTETNLETVREKIRSSFGDTLDRLQVTFGPPTPIAAATVKSEKEPKAKDDAKAIEKEKEKEKEQVKPAADRFAGGSTYTMTLNSIERPSKIADFFRRILAQNKAINVDSFEIVNPKFTARAQADTPSTNLVLRTNLEPAQLEPELKQLSIALRDDPSFLFERQENFGPVVAGETQGYAIVATVASWLIIMGYLWFRFKSISFGFAAILAVVHDVLITLGAVAVTYWLALIPGVSDFLMLDQFKIDLPMIAAFLTLIGFSVNDTIVIFDRIREIRGKTPYMNESMINQAVNETLSRTILTSFTAWMVVVILYMFGGEGLHGFSFCLVVGLISGTYSTIYIASPVLIEWIGDKKSAAAVAKQQEVLGATRV